MNEKDVQNTKNDYELRVRGGDADSVDEKQRPTNPVGLARSIIHVLQQNENPYVVLKSVGPKALQSAMTAFRIASEMFEKRTKGFVLVVRQHEYVAEVNGKRTKGIATRIFPIPVKEAL